MNNELQHTLLSELLVQKNNQHLLLNHNGEFNNAVV